MLPPRDHRLGCAATLLVAATLSLGCAARGQEATSAPARRRDAVGSRSRAATPVELQEETRLRRVRQLTFDGENAEAYWSWDGRRLVFQARRPGEACDSIHVIRADGREDERVASKGAHTCAFFFPGDERILFSSTMSAGGQCPPPPDRSRGYVWALHDAHEIYTARSDGRDVRRLTDSPGYDAEATIARDGRIVFTSVRGGDLDIYLMASDGSGVRQLTSTAGYDGGAVFSPDGKRIAYRARHPEDPQELAEYQDLLARGLVRPGKLEIWIMNADGTDQRPVTQLGAAAFAPIFTPDGRSLLFASNHHDPSRRNFDLFLVPVEGGPVERVTWNDTFDAFPMFSADGRRLAFCSNRSSRVEGDTNVFVADWVP